MNANVIKSYLVELGFDIDNQAKNKFDEALRTATAQITRFTAGMATSFVEAGAAVTTALTAVATATVGMMYETAKSDLQMQLLARRMYTSLPAMREMKMALDALGVSAEDVIYGPPELRQRYQQLVSDQRRVMVGIGGESFEQEMLKIRQVAFEFTRLQQDAQLFVMALTKSLSIALTGDENGLLQKLQGWNEWLIQNIPDLANKFTTYLVPVLRDVRDIWTDIGSVLNIAIGWFTQFIGTIAGDQKLIDGKNNLENIGDAMHHIADWTRAAADATKYLVDQVKGVPEYYFKYMFPPSAIPYLSHKAMDFFYPPIAGHVDSDSPSPSPSAWGPKGSGAVRSAIIASALRHGVDPALAVSVAMQESGMDPNAPHNPGDGYGMMQVLSSTFAKYGHGDINNPQDNLDAGMSLLQALGKTYPGDERSMARAYNGSAGNPKAEQYADSVMSRMGNVTVNIYPQTDDPKAHGEAAAEALLKKMSQRSQVNSNVVYVI